MAISTFSSLHQLELKKYEVPLMKKTKFASCITSEVDRLIKEYDLPQLCDGWTERDEPVLVEVVLENHCSEKREEVREDLRRSLSKSLKQIREYKELCERVEERRRQKYDSCNSHHEKKLLKLWELLVPDEELAKRISKQWHFVGFQGDDPATDFRGMGILALDQLVFFAKYDFDSARDVLQLSNSSLVGFPMAITGITITSTLCTFLYNGDLKNHFYNTVSGSLKMDDFHHAYCQVFKLFSQSWSAANPPSIMSFNSVYDEFCSTLLEKLRDVSANLNTIVI